MSYNFPTLTESVCTLDVDRFPFDQQTCPLVFGSWVYDGTQMDLVVRIVFLDVQQNQDVFNSLFWFNELIEAMGGRFVLLVYDETWIDFVINE